MKSGRTPPLLDSTAASITLASATYRYVDVLFKRFDAKFPAVRAGESQRTSDLQCTSRPWRSTRGCRWRRRRHGSEHPARTHDPSGADAQERVCEGDAATLAQYFDI